VIRLTLLIVLLLTACGDKAEDSGIVSAETQVLSIRIEPKRVSLVTNTDEPAAVQLRAYATMPDGTESETDMVSWTSSNHSAGNVSSSGMFTAADDNGGVTTITATHVGIPGRAKVTVVYEQDIVGSGVDPSLVKAFEDAEPRSGDIPAIEYPLDGVTVPRNLDGLAFAWSMPSGSTVSRVRLQSEITDIRVYVNGNDWTSESELWAIIAAANTSGSVEVTVTSADWNGADLRDVQQGPSMGLTVNRLDARGSVLYWVARAEGGAGPELTEPAGDIMRIPFGQTTAEYFWTSEDSGGNCTGCHTLAESANRMVVTYQGVNGNFAIIDITDPDNPEVLTEPSEERRATFHAASPDGQFLLGVADGRAKLFSMGDGSLITELGLDGYNVSHPDWSPDGEHVLLVRTTSTYMSDMNFEGGEIIQLRFNKADTSFGEPEVLVPASDTYNNYYPAYAPDGQWIAFNRAVRTEITSFDGTVTESSTCYANPSAELWLMRRDGTDKVRLDAANGVGNLQNSFPRWGPLPDDDVLWLAFSTKRVYEPDANTGLPQIWVSAIDTSRVMSGNDPSSTPFWLPGQDSQSDNHLAIWWSK
jgi:hypothetical protein